MRRPRPGRGAVLLLAVTALSPGACAPATAGSAGGAADDMLLPPGYGTLRQEELTMTLRSGDLQLKVTPLEEWMIRLAAPDTYDRLAELAAAHRPALARRAGVASPRLFLVSFFSDEAGVGYDPEDVHLASRGRRFRPLAIRPVTSGWGTQRLPQRETRMAVYAFDPAVDMDLGLMLEYGDVRNRQWDGILQALLAEHARVRARAGSGGEDGAAGARTADVGGGGPGRPATPRGRSA